MQSPGLRTKVAKSKIWINRVLRDSISYCGTKVLQKSHESKKIKAWKKKKTVLEEKTLPFHFRTFRWTDGTVVTFLGMTCMHKYLSVTVSDSAVPHIWEIPKDIWEIPKVINLPRSHPISSPPSTCSPSIEELLKKNLGLCSTTKFWLLDSDLCNVTKIKDVAE